MIERLLAADAALERGDIEAAEKLFGTVAEADPRNAIAAVGMGRVAAGRDDAEGARTWFLRALEIDPQVAAARRLLAALDREVAATELAAAAPELEPDPDAAAAAPVEMPPVEARPRAQAATAAHAPWPARPAAARRPSLVDRIRAWLGRAGRR